MDSKCRFHASRCDRDGSTTSYFRFLNTLKNDSLIVIDNFNPATAQENLLSQFCTLKCKTVFITQNIFTDYPHYKVLAEPPLANELFQIHCADKTPYTDNEMNLLLETVHYHTMTTYAKLLYHQGKFPEAARIFTNCIGITDTVYESNTLTKGYLQVVHAIRNILAFILNN